MFRINGIKHNYVNKDPLKTILFDGNDGSGRPMIYRNPHVPANAEYGYDLTTYVKWQQKGFPQTNVDPYWHWEVRLCGARHRDQRRASEA